MTKEYEVILFNETAGRSWHSKPLGAYRIATELRNHGYTVKVIQYFSRWLSDKELFFKLLKKYVSSKTIFIGFSSIFFRETQRGAITEKYTYNEYKRDRGLLSAWPNPLVAKNVLKEIKTLFPHVKLVYGGTFNSDSDRDIVDCVDFIIRGYGDKQVIDLAKHLRDKQPLMFNLKNRCKVLDYDEKGFSFSFPNSLTTFTEDDDVLYNEVLPIETSRGCLFKCTFCDFPLLGRKKGDPEYIKSEANIVSELVNNYKNFGVSKYMIVDDTFNETTDKIKHVLRAKEKTGIDIKFSAYLRLDIISRYPEQMQLLKELGLQSAFLGIESLDWESAKSIGKGIHPDKIKEVLYKMRDFFNNSTTLHGSFIVGLPNDNHSTLSKWVPWVMEKNCPLDGFDLLPLYILGNSMLAKNPSEYGYSNVVKELKNHYWTNKHWNFNEALSFATSINKEAWESGRLKVSGWDIMGLQNIGFTFDDLKGLPLKNLNRKEIQDKMDRDWNIYKEKILGV